MNTEDTSYQEECARRKDPILLPVVVHFGLVSQFCIFKWGYLVPADQETYLKNIQGKTQMDIELFTIADFAEDMNGKLFITGSFDAIFAATVPAVHPACHIVTRLRLTQADKGHHNISVQISSPDGNTIGPSPKFELDVSPTPGEESAAANLCLGIQHLKFESFGRYTVSLSIDGKQARKLPIFVKRLPDPKPTA